MTASASVVEALIEAQGLLIECQEALIGRDDVCIAEDGSDAIAVWRNKAAAILSTLTPQPTEQDARKAVIAGLRLVHGDMTPSQLERCDSDGHAQRIDAAIQLISALTQAAPDGWRPIETAPKDGTWIVALKIGLHGRFGEPIAPQTCRWGGVEREDSNGHDLEGYEPDLWMPLPPAPPAQGAGG